MVRLIRAPDELPSVVHLFPVGISCLADRFVNTELVNGFMVNTLENVCELWSMGLPNWLILTDCF